MEKNLEHFALYMQTEELENVYYIESKDRSIIKSELLNERFERFFNFALGDHSYEDILFFLKSRTLRDAKKGNLLEIYESLQASKGRIFNDPLSIKFVKFNVSAGDGKWCCRESRF